MTDKHYFTAREIDALIPRLEKIFEHIETCRSRAEELAAQSFRPSGSPVPADLAQAQVLHSQVEFLMEAVQDDVRQLEALGGITKDVELGLVDFLGDVGGQDVWLCWKRGETRVGFWHPFDAGYGQRRALPQPQPNTTLH
jgi:hypothetical protein